MGLGTSGGLLVVSVDVDADGDSAARREGGREIEAATVQILDLLDRRRVPATFAQAHPGASPLSHAITSRRAGHELALLGDASWIGPQAGRTRFARELAWRVRRASDTGFNLGSLALRGIELEGHLDLLVKHRIAAIRESGVAPQNSSRVIRPQLFRYGIWKATASCRLPATGRLWTSAESTIGNAMKSAAFRDEIAHLVVDVPEMLGNERAVVTVLERVLDRVESLREANRLTACTLASAVRTLSRVEVARRAYSLLRVA